MKAKILILALAITFVAAIASLWNYSRIQISIPEIAGEYTVTIENQAGGKATTVKTSASSYSKIVPKGSYRIVVTQGMKSRFFLADTAPFLASTNVTAGLQSQIARSVIADDPGNCAYLIANIALTSTCTGNQNYMTLHTPATATTANTNQEYTAIRGRFMDSLDTSIGTVVLSQAIGDSGPLLHLFTGQIEPAKTVSIKGLRSGTEYRLSPYFSGFLVHNADFSQVQYYTSFGTDPQTITLEAAQTKVAKPAAITTFEQSVAVAYFSEKSEEDHSKNTSEIVLSSPGKTTRHFTTAGKISKLLFCGNQMLCAFNALNNSLQTFKVQDEGLDNAFTIKSVSDFLVYQGQIVVVQGKSIFRINPHDQSGFQEYSFGPYNFCGQHQTTNGYLLCVSDIKNNRWLLKLVETEELTPTAAANQIAADAVHAQFTNPDELKTNFSLTAKLPLITDNYEIEYLAPNPLETKIPLAITSMFINLTNPLASPGDASNLKYIRTSRSAAVVWLNANGYSSERYQLYFRESLGVTEFGGKYLPIN